MNLYCHTSQGQIIYVINFGDFVTNSTKIEGVRIKNKAKSIPGETETIAKKLIV